MKRSIYGICTAALLALGACTTDELPAPDKTQPDGTEQTKPVSGEVLVKLKSYVSDILDQTAARTRSGGPATRSGILSVDEVLDHYPVDRLMHDVALALLAVQTQTTSILNDFPTTPAATQAEKNPA